VGVLFAGSDSRSPYTGTMLVLRFCIFLNFCVIVKGLNKSLFSTLSTGEFLCTVEVGELIYKLKIGEFFCTLAIGEFQMLFICNWS